VNGDHECEDSEHPLPNVISSGGWTSFFAQPLPNNEAISHVLLFSSYEEHSR